MFYRQQTVSGQVEFYVIMFMKEKEEKYYSFIPWNVTFNIFSWVFIFVITAVWFF